MFVPADNPQIAYPQHGETFEEWASLSHLKDTTLEVLRSNEIDDLSTVRLLNAEDIKVCVDCVCFVTDNLDNTR